MCAMSTNTAMSSTLTRSHKLQKCFLQKETSSNLLAISQLCYLEMPGDFESSKLVHTRHWPA